MPDGDSRAQVAVFVSAARIEAAQIDVRPSDWLAWVVMAVGPDQRVRSSQGHTAYYQFESHDLSLPRPNEADERFFSVEGFVSSVELVAVAAHATSEHLAYANSTAAANEPRFSGAIVTFAPNVDAYVVAIDPDEVERGTRLLGTRPSTTSIMMTSWQLDEEGFDVRPGDQLSWRVSSREPGRWLHPMDVARPIDFLADTYLHGEGAGPAVEMDHGSVLPARPAPAFLRIDGTVQTVEVLSRLKAGAQLRDVSTTRHGYDPRVNAYVVTLEPGAELTTSPDGDERYETQR